MLRQLIAAEKAAPAYTIFSDAALIDMVKKHPTSLDDFLDVSGVGVAKQEQYGHVFLAVIRDGREPNDAILDLKSPPAVNQQKGTNWTEAEEQQLRQEYEAEVALNAIAKKHMRTMGAIKARLVKMGLLE